MSRAIAIVLALTFVASFLIPSSGEAKTEIQKIKEQMAELKRNIEQAESRSVEAEQRLATIREERGEAEQELVVLNAELEETLSELAATEQRIDQQEEELAAQTALIEETMQRISDRDELLRSRLHFMYTNGSVSYLEVLFSATSFTDFIERFQSLKSFVGQDRDILDSAKRDEQLFSQQKSSMETLLASLETDYAEVDKLREQQEIQLRNQESIVATLSASEQHWELIHEEEEQFLLEEAARRQTELSSELQEAERKEAERLAALSTRDAKNLDGDLAYPLPSEYRITSEFGNRRDPFTGVNAFHGGTDFGAPRGTNVLAAGSGTVLIAENYRGYGYAVMIDHGGGLWSVYAHMGKGTLTVSSGDYVETGQKVGEVGSTGRSTGPHLHFEVFEYQEKVNPRNYLNL